MPIPTLPEEIILILGVVLLLAYKLIPLLDPPNVIELLVVDVDPAVISKFEASKYVRIAYVLARPVTFPVNVPVMAKLSLVGYKPGTGPTVKFEEGVIVPIPTLPELSIVILAVLFVKNSRG